MYRHWTEAGVEVTDGDVSGYITIITTGSQTVTATRTPSTSMAITMGLHVVFIPGSSPLALGAGVHGFVVAGSLGGSNAKMASTSSSSLGVSSRWKSSSTASSG